MSVVDIASGLVQKVVLLATEEVIQAWNLHDDLETLRKRLESIDALLSDANTRNLTMPAVQNWFNKLEALANVADVFMDELAYEVTRKKIIAVVGMGGQGKTTLARMVYNKDDVINKFPKRMWVTVSDDFDFMKILNQMVVSLTSRPSTLENIEGLINYLQKKLKGVRFLLVLDDVWNEKQGDWDNLRNSLLGVGAARGSNILVTTRKQEVVDTMRCSVCYSVEKLSMEYSWELFKQRAFSHEGVLETEIFKTLGRRMVERCGGLPLAIKTLGSLLHSKKSEQEWLLIDNSEIWKSKGVLSSLRLSYDNLPYPL
ncbi:hypothetical protein DCAR_0728843 [Daucus carota subsp. sativus]|uniref:NB-ARC domain-containing protein n=1 Tax=Daucus carota subsp. sativus TaxID=79200 RepID=A0AAF0XJK1_DAUCS|nr:hypothetical protein DCAR_0728843 [Daucus carota subsp. sativus]